MRLLPGVRHEEPMKIADLVKKKNAKVRVRVPAPRREAIGGAEVVGRITGMSREGMVLWVSVKIPRRGEFLFRPQDLTLLG